MATLRWSGVRFGFLGGRSGCSVGIISDGSLRDRGAGNSVDDGRVGSEGAAAVEMLPRYVFVWDSEPVGEGWVPIVRWPTRLSSRLREVVHSLVPWMADVAMDVRCRESSAPLRLQDTKPLNLASD